MAQSDSPALVDFRDRRVSIAYIFLDIFPELEQAQACCTKPSLQRTFSGDLSLRPALL
jgi:hypothetical protein